MKLSTFSGGRNAIQSNQRIPASDAGWLRLAVFVRSLLSAGLFVAASAAAEVGVVDLTALPLEQLLSLEVSTASKFTQKASEAPSAVTVITADDIRAYGHRTLADILRAIPGLYVTNDRNYSYLGTRGFSRPGDYNTRVLLLVDGYRVNENIYDGAYIGTEFILDVDLIERVEFVPGPGSAIYGSNAFFGVINVVTRKGQAIRGTELSAEAGSFATYKGRTTYGQRSASGVDVLLSATDYQSRGQDLYFPEYNDPTTGNGVARNADNDLARQFFGKIAYHDFTLETGFSNRIKGIPTAAYGQDFGPFGSRSQDDQFFINAKYLGALTPTLDLQASVYYGKYYYEGRYIFSGVYNMDESHGEWWGTDIHFLSRAIERHKLLVGSEYRDDSRRDMMNYDVSPYALLLDERRSKRAYALYVQDEWSATDSTIFNVGVRHDASNEDASTTNPRFALIQKLAPKTTVRLLYGTAFRAPNVYEKYYAATSLNYKQNPDLLPETIRTSELVLEHYLQDDFRVAGSLFAYRIKDLITLITDPADDKLVYKNVNEVVAHGAQIEAERHWPGGARVRASYSWQQAEVQTSGLGLSNSPRHLVKLNVTRPFHNGLWYAGSEVQYVSQRTTPFGNTVEDYTVVNLTLHTDRLAKNLDVSASLYNLFNSAYADPPSEEHTTTINGNPYNLTRITQDGRVYRLKLTYRF